MIHGETSYRLESFFPMNEYAMPLLAGLVCVVAFVVTDTRRWLDRESKFFLSVVYAAAAIAACLVFYLPDNQKSPTVTIVAATLAAIGWVITNHQNRVYNRIQYTNTQIDHYRNDAEIQKCVLLIKEEFLMKSPIEMSDVEKIWADYHNESNYNAKEKLAPTLHHIVHILNFFERIAYLYMNDLVEHRLFYRHFNIILGKQIVRLQNVIRKIRTADPGKKSYNDLLRLLIDWYSFDIDSAEILTENKVATSRREEFYR
jgi:amino acid transporter